MSMVSAIVLKMDLMEDKRAVVIVSSVYDKLGKMVFKHSRVHHKEKVYVSGDVHTNTIEVFWSHFKRGVSGVYRGVSSKHFQSYSDEFVFRYNNCTEDERGLFPAILARIEKAYHVPEPPS